MKTYLIPLSLSLMLPLAQADPLEEAHLIGRESSRIETEMYHTIPDIDERDPLLKTLRAETRKATAAVKEALDTHPALAEQRKKRDEAFAHLNVVINKGTKGEDAEKQAAQKAYSEANNELSIKAREIPDIEALQEASIQAEKAYRERKALAYAAQPETAEMAKKAAALQDKANELRRSVKQD